MEAIKSYITKHRPLCLGILLLIVAIFPLVFRQEYILAVAVKILIFMIYASALNVTNGYSGMFNIGVSTFMCISCYATALISTNYDLPFLVVLALTCIITTISGLLVVLPTFRLTGMFFTIVTLGIAETVRVIALNWNSFTNGPLGISGIPHARIFGFEFSTSTQYYYLALVLLVLVLICIYRIINSRIGTAWKSIRENQDAASSLGINVPVYKMMNVMCSAFFVAVGGTLFAYYYRFIEPGNFAIDRGHEVLAMVALGGMGTLPGPLLGSLIVNIFTQVLRSASEFRMVLYGVFIIIVMWVRPQGLVGASNSVLAMKRESKSIKQKSNKAKAERR